MIFTHSSFYYGHVLSENNLYLSFREPFDTDTSEKIAELNVGDYSLSEFVDELARALNARGAQEYTVTIDRTTRIITISASQVFELLISSGNTVAISVFGLAGFSGSDLTGLTTYEATQASGKEYFPQFKLQSYVDLRDNIRKSQASVNESASGIPEIVSFGKIREMECDILFATDIDQGDEKLGSPIRTNLTGVQDLRDFVEAITDKNTIEFIPNRNDPDTFNKMILESSEDSGEGIKIQVKEIRTSGMTGYYKTGKLVFREVS